MSKSERHYFTQSLILTEYRSTLPNIKGFTGVIIKTRVYERFGTVRGNPPQEIKGLGT